jgi:hypothetical protein
MQAAEDLHTYGVAVVPVMDADSRAFWERRLFDALDEMPEYTRTGRRVQRVLGGFGALGNPSSFHHPTVRAFRRLLKRLAIRPVFDAYVDTVYPRADPPVRLEALYDRLCVRCEDFQRPTAEAWHRDIYDGPQFGLRPLPRTLPDDAMDRMYGGWTNLHRVDQHFVGLVGSHGDGGSDEGGFSQFSKEAIARFGFAARLVAQANQCYGHSLRCNASGEIVVPPGHAIVFMQRLVHSVKSGPQSADPALRVFHGFRLTTEETPLFDLREVLGNGAVPRIPSGQLPVMYSKHHYAAFASKTESKWREWAETTFKAECRFERTTPVGLQYATPGSADNTNAEANRGRYMPSLRAMGLWSDTFSYTDAERSALWPEVVGTHAVA